MHCILKILRNVYSNTKISMLTPIRWPMVIEKPIARAAEPRRPFRLSSVTAKTQTTNCMVRNTSTVVAMPRLMPGCSCRDIKYKKSFKNI